MRNPIPSEVWEKKKELIAKLYKDEEWPLKQVIKQIRTEDFDPSETQLRSRLKKWRVTKPSRQTRKKPQAGQQDEASKDDEQDSPKQKKKAVKQELPVTGQGWYLSNGMYSPQDHHRLPVTTPLSGQSITKSWIPAVVQQQQSPSPQGDDCHDLNGPQAMQHFAHPLSRSSSYNQLHPSPVAESAMVNTLTPVITPPAYPTTTYPLSPVSRLQSPLPTTTGPCQVQWSTPSDPAGLGVSPSMGPVAQWYAVTSEPQSVPFYAITSVSSSMGGYEEQVQSVPPQTPGSMYSPQSPEYTSLLQEDTTSTGDAKPWKRAIPSAHYDLDAGHSRVDQNGRLRIHVDGRPLEESTSDTTIQPVSPIPHYLPAGFNDSLICAPVYPYPDQGQQLLESHHHPWE